MINSDAIQVSIDIAVDPATAFEVFTQDMDVWWKKDRRYRFNWNKPIGTMRLEPRLAGRVMEVYDDGSHYYVGKILVWEPPQRLVFEWRSPNYRQDQVTEVEVQFKAIDTGTRASIEHRGWQHIPADHPARHQTKDWDFIFLWGGMWRDHLQALQTISERFQGDHIRHNKM